MHHHHRFDGMNQPDQLVARDLDHGSLASLPLQVLQAELRRRQETSQEKPACGSGANKGSYNVPIHVFALFLILIVSTLGCSFPIIARRFPKFPVPHRFFFISRHFGTGVLIATAFIHLLPTAFTSMTDPCLPRFWNKTYPPMPGLIAMLSVFAVVVVEMYFAMKGAGHSHSAEWEKLHDRPPHAEFLPRQETSQDHPIRVSQEQRRRRDERLDVPLSMASSPRRSNDSDLDLDDLDMRNDESAYLSDPIAQKVHQSELRLDVLQGGTSDNPQKQLVQCLMLEAGILFHSIFIGMAVSVATGTSFVVLLIAIVFHQTFEGFALGARIAALIPDLFDATSPKPWLMALAYGTTTPIGQALGLILHRMYDPQSEAGLLVVGITNAISSGLLLFAGLVQLLAEDFLSDHSYDVLKGRRRIEACLSVFAGGLLMALVGAFA